MIVHIVKAAYTGCILGLRDKKDHDQSCNGFLEDGKFAEEFEKNFPNGEHCHGYEPAEGKKTCVCLDKIEPHHIFYADNIDIRYSGCVCDQYLCGDSSIKAYRGDAKILDEDLEDIQKVTVDGIQVYPPLP